MFGTGTMSLYARYHDAVSTPASRKSPKAARPSTSSPSKHHSPSDSWSMEQLSSASVSEFLGPAVDRPPSSQKLRQLSRQMKRASHLQGHHGHKTVSSESSSRSSLAAPDRIPWDLALDNLSLVRKCSTPSHDGNTPSWGRPESTHNFGRNFFHRRARSNRESSAHDSVSSIYSQDAPAEDSSAVGGKEGILPAIFSRVKASRDQAAPKRPYISGPFNFQHVAHTRRDEARKETYPVALVDGPMGVPCLESRITSCDPETGDSTRPPPITKDSPRSSGPRRFIKHIRSQDQLHKNQSPPPSPAEQPRGSSPFVLALPPRTSSRQSSHRDVSASLNAVMNMHSTTSNKAHPQLPFWNTFPRENSTEEELGPHESVPVAHTEQQFSTTDEKPLPCVISSARDSTWPLPTPTSFICDSALSDVAEEEEHHWLSRLSRLSLSSNSSSLRAVQSVPILRSLAESCRPMSGASETLGAVDIMGSDRLACKDTQAPAVHVGTPAPENWEALIDYCYEHEAEANCDYEWDRSSLDMSIDGTNPPGIALAVCEPGPQSNSNARSQSSQVSFSPTVLEGPFLSPASNNSSTRFETEAASSPKSPALNNFSLPRGDGKHPLSLNWSSGCLTFRESQNFTLSPSFLIPCDYKQQMLQHQVEKQDYADFEFPAKNCQTSASHDDGVLTLGNNTPFLVTGQRISTSTTATSSTFRSNSIGRQYRSSNSSWTTLNRRTPSSTSLSNMAGALTDDSAPLAAAPATDVAHEETRGAGASHAPQDHVPDLIAFPQTT